MKPKFVIIVFLTFVICGCMGVSMHSLYQTGITVTNLETGVPAKNIPLAVAYDYDSYGWFYFANSPTPVNSVTDQAGQAVAAIADYRYRILLKVGGELSTPSKQMIQEGGSVTTKTYRVTLKPL